MLLTERPKIKNMGCIRQIAQFFGQFFTLWQADGQIELRATVEQLLTGQAGDHTNEDRLFVREDIPAMGNSSCLGYLLFDLELLTQDKPA